MLVGVLVISGGAAHVSLVLNPLPDIDTVAPGLAKVGLSVIFGAGIVTVNCADIEGPGTTFPLVRIT
jgi:hypothetical protein